MYRILRDDGTEIDAKPRGILRRGGTIPYPGDRITLSLSGDPDIPYCIDSIVPRRNFLPRPALANLDLVLVTVSAAQPPPDFYFIEKMIILSAKSGIGAAICVTKADLDPAAAQSIRSVYGSAGYRVIILGGRTAEDGGMAELRELVRGRTITFAGQSGVGKSTVFNRIIGSDRMDVGSVSGKNRKGRHTTKHSEVMPFDGGFIADTPGFSVLEIIEAGVTGEEVLRAYPEILQAADHCRFASCRHIGEKGCAVGEGDVEPGRLARYRIFRRQADDAGRTG